MDWLGNVAMALACTGMRISELASLRWSDIDFVSNMIKLTDEPPGLFHGGKPGRQMKNHCGRSFPIHEDLLQVLELLTPLRWPCLSWPSWRRYKSRSGAPEL